MGEQNLEEKGILPASKIYFHTSSVFSKQAHFHLANGGRYFCNHFYETKRNHYEQYLFLYVKKGKMKVQYEDYEFIANDNTCIFLDCHSPHLYKTLEETNFDWFHFKGSASKEYFEFLFHKHGCVFTMANNWKAADYFNQVLDMMENEQVDEHLASIIIHQILYELERISNQADITIEETIKQAISYIEENYSKDITLNDIAKHVKLSSFHFSRLFKKHTNSTPHQYLISYRINNAKKLLYNSNLPINEIGFLCGFNSVSYFVTAFKNYTDYTPKKYREFLRKI